MRIVVLLFISFCYIFANNQILINSKNINITDTTLYYFIDKNSSYDIDDIKNIKFELNKKNKSYFPANQTIWFCFDIKNTTESESNIYINFDNIHIEFPSNTFGASSKFGECGTTTNSTTTTTTSSGGGGEFFAPTSNSKLEFNSNSLNFSINSNQDVDGNKIFTNTEKIGDLESKSTIKIGSIISINMRFGNKTGENETNVAMPKNATISMAQDGSITQTFTKNNSKIIITIDTNGKVDSSVTIGGKSFSFKAPIGSNLEIKESGNLVATKEINTNSGKVIAKIEVLPNGETINTVTLNNKELSFSFPNDSSSRDIIIESDGITGNFKSKDIFYIVKNSNYSRGLSIGSDSIQITPNIQAEFKEKIYTNNYRGLTLTEGNATITIDDNKIDMQKDKEYIIITTNSNALNQIFFDNRYLSLRSGWNLIANPVNSEINISSKFTDSNISYKYTNNQWITNPTTLKQGEGLWILSKNNTNVTFTEFNTSSEYNINLNQIQNGWNLLGAGSDINIVNISSYKAIWSFDYFSKMWVKEPFMIPKGYGFWLQK